MIILIAFDLCCLLLVACRWCPTTENRKLETGNCFSMITFGFLKDLAPDSSNKQQATSNKRQAGNYEAGC
jgi:hypothetical protein